MSHYQRLRRTDTSGFTLIELLITVGIIGVLAIVTVPSLLRAKMSGNEASAIGSLRAINTAESAYSGSAAQGSYTPSLAVLALPCPGGTVGFISPDLADDPSQKSGYVITLTAGTAAPGLNDCNGTPSTQGYYLTAVPMTIGTTGLRGFASSSRGVVFFDKSGAAPSEASMAPGGGGMVIQ
jgi:prepilin-type N-terminal cleavage/methylation domain-containing protein